MKVTKIRHAWREDADFGIYRPHGTLNEYVFLHFWNPMQMFYRGEMITTFPNACIILSPSEAQQFGCKDACIHDWMHISEDVGAVLSEYEIEANCIYYPRNHEFITDIIRRIEVESKTGDTYSEDLCACLVRELLVRFAREVHSEADAKSLNGQTREQLRKLRRILHFDYMRNWEISEMAKYINVSPSHLHSAYKKLYGVSPIQDLINIRIQQAKSMLSETQRSVSDIASALGYASATHFTRQFTKIVGISPLKYRQSNLLENRHIFT